jgi:hypothetical protein
MKAAGIHGLGRLALAEVAERGDAALADADIRLADPVGRDAHPAFYDKVERLA